MIYDFAIDMGIIHTLARVPGKQLRVSEITSGVCRHNNESLEELTPYQQKAIRERVYRHVKKLAKLGYVKTHNTLTDLKTPLLKVEITEKAKYQETC
jgi:hypothetical protein